MEMQLRAAVVLGRNPVHHLDPLPVEPKIDKFRQSVEDYTCANFHAIPIGDFRFIVLTYTPTHIVTR